MEISLRTLAVLSIATTACSIGALPPPTDAAVTADGAAAPTVDVAGVGGAAGADAPASGGASGGGGIATTGGVAGVGGVGGVGDSGGVLSTGGTRATGGAIAAGGTIGTGGSGPVPASGGMPGAGGTSIRTGSGGATRTGGATGVGGGIASGGVISSGGLTASAGGAPGSGGRPDPGTGGSSGTTPPVSCGSTAIYVGTKTPGTAPAGAITVDPTKTHQIVDGFGLADVWQGSSSAAMQTLLWDPVNGIGLNLLRIGIDGTSGKANIMGAAGYADGQACVKYAGCACKVWAAPWSPPAADKDNNNVNNGGHLNPASYSSWAASLAAFPAFYKQNGGVDLYAISAQNEPDYTASYQSCLFSASQMVAWINVLGPLLAALDPPVKVMAPEPDNWGNLWGGDNYGTAILADATASSYVEPIAVHDYGSTSAGTYRRPAPPANNTHHIWETECTPGDTGPITIATMVYAAFATGGVNGWHYWWTQSFVPNASSPPAQYYALGNFSKFVRPGYYRVDVSGDAQASGTVPLVVAFSNLSDGTVAIVVVNGGSAQQISLFIAGTAWPASVTPYVTTSSSKLAAGTAITVTAGAFSASLAAQSVTTFVGKP